MIRPTTEAGLLDGSWVGAWAGLAFTGTFIVYLVVGVAAGPRFTDSGTELRPFLEDHAGSLRVAIAVIGVGLLFFLLPFVALVAQRIESARPGLRWLAQLTLAAATVSVAVFLISATIAGAVLLAGVESVSDATLELAWQADAILIVSLFHVSTGLWIGAVSAAILATGMLPRWLGWLGLTSLGAQLGAATWLLGGEVTELHDALAGIGQLSAFLIWVPAASVALIRRGADPVR
jgi:hypothetical protein